MNPLTVKIQLLKLLSQLALSFWSKPISRGPFGPGPLISRQEPPAMPGHYRWIDRDGKVIYIGVSNNLRRRHREHLYTERFRDHTFIFKAARFGATCIAIYLHEMNKIKKYQPHLNRNAGGGGPRWITHSIP